MQKGEPLKSWTHRRGGGWKIAINFPVKNEFIWISMGLTSGVARAFPGGRLAHPEGQNEEENK